MSRGKWYQYNIFTVFYSIPTFKPYLYGSRKLLNLIKYETRLKHVYKRLLDYTYYTGEVIL